MTASDGFPSDAIAIVGMSGRFPGARTLDDFWRNIRDGVEALETFSDADLEAAGVEPGTARLANYVRRGTVLEDADLFDAGFFGMTPRDVRILDPQQRIFLECAWEALEHAGHTGAGQSIGVYAGSSMNTYLLTQLLRNWGVLVSAGGYQIMLGNDKDFLCTRVSYKLDLRGPSVAVQTACSTSLVAVVLACRAVARGECDMALAGGVSVSFPQRSGYVYEAGMILSPDGHCRPFDAKAGGTRGGAGCGIVVLKRLAEAVADRDTIHAVITGAAMNNDGAGKTGYTAPSVDGQAEVIATALSLAAVDARSIGYLEAHGTATPLGDPIEVAALTQAFRGWTDDVGFCRLGSLKANLGHLDAAAGVAGLIKTVLVLEHREFPPLVNFTAANPQLDLESSPFAASPTGSPWLSDSARRAGVSSFGIGGTNAHVVLQEAPAVVETPSLRRAHLLLLSARTSAALDRSSANLAAHLAGSTVPLQDVEWTLKIGRKTFAHRRAVVVHDREEAIDRLSRPQAQPLLSAVHDGGERRVAFLFGGQGSQFAGMGSMLYEQEPVFAAAVDRCADLLTPHLRQDLRRVMFDRASAADINQTALAQPALFVMSYALASLWTAWGIKPAALLGHSIGEYVAAHLAGVMSLEDALAVVAARGRLMQALPAGQMAAVHLSAAKVARYLPDDVAIAAINAPDLCTVSGPTASLAGLIQRLTGDAIEVRPLQTSHAFHSSMMAPALQPFVDILSRVSLHPPTTPYLSNVTGTWITSQQATDPAYYADQLRSTVRFEAGVRLLGADPGLVLLEVGPGTALTTLAGMTLGAQASRRALASQPRAGDAAREGDAILEAAGRLWLQGVALDFESMHRQTRPRRVPLPTYPFERERYWVDAEAAAPGAPRSRPSAIGDNRPLTLDDAVFAPTWVNDDAARVADPAGQGMWLVLGDDGALSREVVALASEAGCEVVMVRQASSFAKASDSSFTVRPGSVDDIAAVVSALRRPGVPGSPPHIAGAIHLWDVTANPLSGNQTYAVLVALGNGMSPSPAAPVHVVHATAGAQALLDEPVTRPEKALAIGPVLVLPTELPGLSVRAVDVAATVEAIDPRQAASALVAETVWNADTGLRGNTSVTAWRNGRRWVRRFAPIRLPGLKGGHAVLKQRGVYLITGGLGGLGLTFAQWLARTCEARLLLISRTSAPPREEWDALLVADPGDTRIKRTIAALKNIEAAGGEALVFAASVADLDGMKAAIDGALQQWGRIDGVIHAAGIPGKGQLASRKTPDDVEAVFAAKVSGLEVLTTLLGDRELDFMALMSSVNAVVGAPGLADYASANAYMDAFAESSIASRSWRRVVSVNWGAWRDVGMAADLAADSLRRDDRNDDLASAIAPEAGVAILERVLRSGLKRVAVVPFDLQAFMSEDRPDQVTPRRAPLPSPGAAAAGGNASEAAAGLDVTASDLEQQILVIWAELLGLETIGLHDDFFELGGHSLLATRVLARMRDELGVALTLRDVFEQSTVNKMAARVSAALSQATVGASAGTGGADIEREELEF
jgi:phthiocerol/phenolphthiocerol synthesis type-I polyketide synthase E